MGCYFLCKGLFKTCFSGEELGLDKGPCSYFAKTIILWMIEKHPAEFWITNAALSCTKEFLRILEKCVKEKSCSNSFVPENHMMSTFTEAQIRAFLLKHQVVTSCLFFYLFKKKQPNEIHSTVKQ